MTRSILTVKCIHPPYTRDHSLTAVSDIRRYFEGGVSSVFLWDLEDGGFAGVVLLKKCSNALLYFRLSPPAYTCLALSPATETEPTGAWDSIHVFEVAERGRQAHYKLTSTIMLSMVNRAVGKSSKDDKVEGKRDGEVTLSGSMTRQVSLSCPGVGIYLISYLRRRSRTIPYKIRPHISRISGA